MVATRGIVRIVRLLRRDTDCGNLLDFLFCPFHRMYAANSYTFSLRAVAERAMSMNSMVQLVAKSNVARSSGTVFPSGMRRGQDVPVNKLVSS